MVVSGAFAGSQEFDFGEVLTTTGEICRVTQPDSSTVSVVQ